MIIFLMITIHTDPALLPLANAFSIADGRHPAANDFQENEQMARHFND